MAAFSAFAFDRAAFDPSSFSLGGAVDVRVSWIEFDANAVADVPAYVPGSGGQGRIVCDSDVVRKVKHGKTHKKRRNEQALLALLM